MMAKDSRNCLFSSNTQIQITYLKNTEQDLLIAHNVVTENEYFKSAWIAVKMSQTYLYY